MNDPLTELLSERFPWASTARLQTATALLKDHLDAADAESEFTMEMLEAAENLGHQLAAVIGTPPIIDKGGK